jgi:hypothetical protein
MRSSLHPRSTPGLAWFRHRPWLNSAGCWNSKSHPNSRRAGFKRWVREFSYRQATATVVIGGILSSTFLTLVLVPVLYEWAEGKGRPAISVRMIT